jgi:hypothetical protein
MAAALSNNLNECALCEAAAQKAEHCSHVREKLENRGAPIISQMPHVGDFSRCKACRIDTSASGRFCGD